MRREVGTGVTLQPPTPPTPNTNTLLEQDRPSQIQAKTSYCARGRHSIAGGKTDAATQYKAEAASACVREIVEREGGGGGGEQKETYCLKSLTTCSLSLSRISHVWPRPKTRICASPGEAANREGRSRGWARRLKWQMLTVTVQRLSTYFATKRLVELVGSASAARSLSLDSLTRAGSVTAVGPLTRAVPGPWYPSMPRRRQQGQPHGFCCYRQKSERDRENERERERERERGSERERERERESESKRGRRKGAEKRSREPRERRNNER